MQVIFEKSVNYFDYVVTQNHSTYYNLAALVSDKNWYVHQFRKRLVIVSSLYDSSIHLWSSAVSEECVSDRKLFENKILLYIRKYAKEYQAEKIYFRYCEIL